MEFHMLPKDGALVSTIATESAREDKHTFQILRNYVHYNWQEPFDGKKVQP